MILDKSWLLEDDANSSRNLFLHLETQSCSCQASRPRLASKGRKMDLEMWITCIGIRTYMKESNRSREFTCSILVHLYVHLISSFCCLISKDLKLQRVWIWPGDGISQEVEFGALRWVAESVLPFPGPTDNKSHLDSIPRYPRRWNIMESSWFLWRFWISTFCHAGQATKAFFPKKRVLRVEEIWKSAVFNSSADKVRRPLGGHRHLPSAATLCHQRHRRHGGSWISLSGWSKLNLELDK